MEPQRNPTKNGLDSPTIQIAYAWHNLVGIWTARGADGDVGVPARYDVYVNGAIRYTNLSPEQPGTDVCVNIGGLSACTAYGTSVVTTDANGDVALSNTVQGTTSCTAMLDYNCNFGGNPITGGGASVVSGDEEDGARAGPRLEYLLATTPGEVGRLRCSIPRDQQGAMYELALFDIAGRRVLSIAQGAVQAGGFQREIAAKSLGGDGLKSGVYFVRLRIGRQDLSRMLVLAR